MTLLMGMISLVLVVACVNVSGILIAQGITRHREMAVRLSLGATRARLVRQLLAETAAISLLGAAGGLLLARVLVALSAAWLGTMPFPIVISLGVDGRVTAYTAGLSLVAAFITGLLPALRTSSAQPMAAIKGDETALWPARGFGGSWSSPQVALSMTLVVLAACSRARSRRREPSIRASIRGRRVDDGRSWHGGYTPSDRGRLSARRSSIASGASRHRTRDAVRGRCRVGSRRFVLDSVRRACPARTMTSSLDGNIVEPGLLRDARHSDCGGT